MITLHQFPPAWDIPNPSPFCAKVEAYLRFANIPYKNHYTINTKINPKHKLPAIEVDGKIIGDSDIIFDYLKEHYGDPLDQNLTAEQTALATLIERTFAEHAYWCVVCFRWKHEPEWTAIKNLFFSKVPKLMRNFVANKINKSFQKAMYGQGMGRHDFDEICQMLDRDLQALSTILGDKEFFLGDKLTSIDCTAYGFLINLFAVPFEHRLKDLAKNYSNLEHYSERMHERFKAAG